MNHLLTWEKYMIKFSKVLLCAQHFGISFINAIQSLIFLEFKYVRLRTYFPFSLFASLWISVHIISRRSALKLLAYIINGEMVHCIDVCSSKDINFTNAVVYKQIMRIII